MKPMLPLGRRMAAAALFVGAALGSGASAAAAQQAAGQPAAGDSAAAKLPPEALEALVAPIALFPDDLLAQTLVASTYPLEIVQLHQWMAKHPDLKDKALADSVARQPWEASIQSMAAVPELVKRLADDIQWTTDLGNAFLAQQAEVMNAVQRLRKKAQGKGALETNEQQKVETKVVEKDTVIVVQSANPEIVYVPTYSPSVVYGPPPMYYPYPPIYYPPYTPGAAFVSFSFGFMMGAAIWGGSCCYAGWGGSNNIIINNNNNFNQINHNRGGRGSGNWEHNPSHRGGAPYGDRATASKFGGSSGRGGASAATRPSSSGGWNRAGTQPSATPATRGGTASRGPTASSQIGSRDVSPGSGSRSASGLSGGSRGYSGSSARASSSRGASSFGGSRGGTRGGGGRRR